MKYFSLRQSVQELVTLQRMPDIFDTVYISYSNGSIMPCRREEYISLAKHAELAISLPIELHIPCLPTLDNRNLNREILQKHPVSALPRRRPLYADGNQYGRSFCKLVKMLFKMQITPPS